jgi:hypothetical protein
MSASPIELPGRSFPVLSLAEAPLPDALPAVVPSRTARFMAAYAVAEHVTAASPVAPWSTSVAMHEDWGYVPGSFEYRVGPQLHFGSAGEVRRFAEALGLVVVDEPRGRDQAYVFADGVMDEVPFRAWTLAKSPAVAS